MQRQPDVPKQSLVEVFKKDLKHLNNISPKDVQTIVPGEIYILDNFFPDSLCNELVKATEKISYEDALLTTGIGVGVMDKSVRDSQRVMIDDFQSATLLFNIFKKIAPLCQEGAYLNSVNERFRYLKYDVNGQFVPHIDGTFPRKREISIITIHFYLNTVQKGGGTSFFIDYWSPASYTVKSEIGKLAMFRQDNNIHSGDKVEKGLKYSVRNELMYKYLNNEEQKSAEQKLEICGICSSTPQFIELKCGHHFCVCKCPPFSSKRMKKIKNLEQYIKEKYNCPICHRW